MYKDIVDRAGNYNTPKYLFNYLHKHFRFELDPCDSGNKWLGLPYNFSEKDDGLLQEWDKNTFVNPPYNSFNENIWIKKCILEFNKYRKNIFIILPAKTEASWFSYAMQQAEIIIFPQGRISFIKNDKTMNGNTMGSAIFGFVNMFEGPMDIYTDDGKRYLRFLGENNSLDIPCVDLQEGGSMFFPNRDKLKEYYLSL